MEQGARFRLSDMAEYASLSLTFIEGRTAEDIEPDLKTHLALVRSVQIVGEAAAKLPEAFRVSNPQIPWRRAINMRNILVHAYRQIDLTIVLATVREDFPPLIAEIERLLGETDT